ncbi:hypothetical protein KAH81_09150 [bacterium]|nr:hypothetical protein [bacterium]
MFLSLLLAIIPFRAAFCANDGHIDWPASCGIASSVSCQGVTAFWGNPANIFTEGWSSSVYANREWGLDELSSINAALGKDFRWGNIALGGQYFGSSNLYSESNLGVAFARPVYKCNTGIKLSILSVKSGDWSALTPIIGAGIKIPANQAVDISLWGDNITFSKLDGNEIPVRGTMGVVFKPTDWARLAFDIYSQSQNSVSLRFGQEVFIFKTLKLRCGVAFKPTNFHLGLGIKVRDIEFNWAYIGHPELGGSTQLGIIYER